MRNDCLMGTGIWGASNENVLKLEHFSVLAIIVMVHTPL